MKPKITVILLSLFTLANFAKAQTSCEINLSLMNESARNEQFAEAFGPWKAVFEECPGESLAIYQRGVDILRWKLANAAERGDMEAYNEYFDLLLKVFDKRIEHFGTHASFPAPRVLGMKALEYIRFAQGDELRRRAYEWLKQSIEGMGDATDLAILQQFVVLSNRMFQADSEYVGTFIDDYLKATDILTRQANNTANERIATAASQIRQELEAMFIQSGAANCEVLDNIYAEAVNENLDNLDFLNQVMAFYRRIGCTEQEVFFTAAAAAHRIQPTVASAFGGAQRAVRRNEFARAIEYFEEATRLSTDNEERSNFQFAIALIQYSNFNNFNRARASALRALEFNPSSGRAHILIARMYASTKNLTDDPVLNKTVYWAAVDRFQRARQVDNSPEVVAEANNMIRSFSQHFPTREEIFFHPTLNAIGEGGTFTVGGWINERTTVRAATQ